MDGIIFIKWSPSVNEHMYEKSKLEDKHKIVGGQVMETILQEGCDFMKSESKREDNFNRMNDRELVAQTSMNPFLSSNYLEDLQVQETFLTPQNSNNIQH